MPKLIKKAVIGSALVLLLAGCSVAPSDPDVTDTIENGGSYKIEVKTDIKDKKENGTETKKEEMKQENPKILSTYKIESETLHFDKDLKSIVDEVHKSGGYISSNEITTSKSNYLKESNLSIKVPKENLDGVIKTIDDKLAITYELLSSVDVAETYYDNESKLKNIELREKRLRELYKKAENISETVKIDEKLNEVAIQKEELKRNQVKIDNRLSFFRIDLTIKEVKKISTAKSEDISSSEKISNAFSNIGGIAKSILVGVVIFLVFALPLVLLGGIGYVVQKRVSLKLKERKYGEPQDKDVVQNNEELQDNGNKEDNSKID